MDIDTTQALPSDASVLLQYDISSFISLLAAFFSAIAALAAAYVAWKTYRDNRAPKVIAYLADGHEGSDADFIVKNIGNGVAYDVVVSGFDFRICYPDWRESNEDTFISNGIPMLAPGQERGTSICPYTYAARNLKGMSVEVQIRCSKKPQGPSGCQGSYVLEFDSFLNSLHSTPDMHVIASSMSMLSKDIHKLVRRSGKS